MGLTKVSGHLCCIIFWKGGMDFFFRLVYKEEEREGGKRIPRYCLIGQK